LYVWNQGKFKEIMMTL